jgi:hypothetical protein
MYTLLQQEMLERAKLSWGWGSRHHSYHLILSTVEGFIKIKALNYNLWPSSR